MGASGDIEWLSLRNHFKNHSQMISQSYFVKVLDKCSQYWVPAVAVGVFSTTTALVAGMYKCVAGRERTSQMMMRTRILAQGFTLAALVVGCMNSGYKYSPPVTQTNDPEPLPCRAIAKSIPMPIK